MKLIKFSLILLIPLLLAGCFKNSPDYDEETITKAEVVVNRFLENNYTDIETVKIEDVFTGPLGGMTVNGTVNGKYGFNIGIDESDFTINSIGEKEGFPEEKEECKVKTCDY